MFTDTPTLEQVRQVGVPHVCEHLGQPGAIVNGWYSTTQSSMYIWHATLVGLLFACARRVPAAAEEAQSEPPAGFAEHTRAPYRCVAWPV